MKKIFTLAMMMVMTISANAMSYNTAKNEALFLSDKMAYELNLSNAQYDAVYEINLDYMMSVNGRNDVYGSWWSRRNTDLKYVLTAWQYEKYMEKSYFYRPLTWKNGNWTFNIYSHYSNKKHFYKNRPTNYTSYKGGNNKKSGHFYAERNVNKPTSTPTGNHGYGNNGRHTAGNGNNGTTAPMHYSSDHDMALNTNNNHSGSGHNGNSGHNGASNHNGNSNHNGSSSHFGARR